MPWNNWLVWFVLDVRYQINAIWYELNISSPLDWPFVQKLHQADNKHAISFRYYLLCGEYIGDRLFWPVLGEFVFSEVLEKLQNACLKTKVIAVLTLETISKETTDNDV